MSLVCDCGLLTIHRPAQPRYKFGEVLIEFNHLLQQTLRCLRVLRGIINREASLQQDLKRASPSVERDFITIEESVVTQGGHSFTVKIFGESGFDLSGLLQSP
jgi:hypothetical protein